MAHFLSSRSSGSNDALPICPKYIIAEWTDDTQERASLARSGHIYIYIFSSPRKGGVREGGQNVAMLEETSGRRVEREGRYRYPGGESRQGQRDSGSPRSRSSRSVPPPVGTAPLAARPIAYQQDEGQYR